MTEEIRTEEHKRLIDAIEENPGAFVQRAARKLAKEYGLTEHEFEIVYIPVKRSQISRGYRIGAGVTPLVTFFVHPFDKEFEFALRNALKQIEKVKLCGALDLMVRINERNEWAQSIAPHFNIPKLNANEIELTLERKVTIRDKVTGLVSIMEAVEGSATWSELVRRAKNELSQLREAVKMLKEKKDAPQNT